MSQWNKVNEISKHRIEEQYDNNDAVDFVLTFDEEIDAIEIWHNEGSLQTFTVNGMDLKIAGGGWRSLIGGTPSVEVTIPSGVTCTVARLV